MDSERQCTSSGLAKAFNYLACKSPKSFHFKHLVHHYHEHRLSNEKPSAIFRLRGTFSSSSASAAQDRFSAYSTEQGGAAQDVTAILGISIEPLTQIQYQIASLHATGSGAVASSKPDLASQPGLLAERIVKHLINYVSSFLGGGVGPEVMLPMSIIVKWYESFLSKVKAGGIGFLERDE
jgi:hypothetical protein